MLLNSLLIKTINSILASNTGSRHLLAKYSGKSFKLGLNELYISAVCDINGYLTDYQQTDYNVIIVTPPACATFIINRDKLELYKKLIFTGDTDFGRNLLEIFSKLHLNGIYTKANSALSVFFINKFTNLIQGLNDYLAFISNNAALSCKEYLLYETQDIITGFEHDKFCNDVDELRERSEYLEKQIYEYTHRL